MKCSRHETARDMDAPDLIKALERIGIERAPWSQSVAGAQLKRTR